MAASERPEPRLAARPPPRWPAVVVEPAQRPGGDRPPGRPVRPDRRAVAVCRERCYERRDATQRARFIAVVVIAVLNVLDLITTYAAIAAGAHEGDPLVSWAISSPLVAVAKVLVCGTLILGAVVASRTASRGAAARRCAPHGPWSASTGPGACCSTTSTSPLQRSRGVRAASAGGSLASRCGSVQGGEIGVRGRRGERLVEQQAGGAGGQGHDGERRVVARRGGEHRRVDDEHVVDVPEPAVGVDHRRAPGRRPSGWCP